MVVLEQGTDLTRQQCCGNNSNLYSGQWHFYIPVVSEHMTELKPHSDWVMKFLHGLSTGPTFCPKSLDPSGLGMRLVQGTINHSDLLSVNAKSFIILVFKV